MLVNGKNPSRLLLLEPQVLRVQMPDLGQPLALDDPLCSISIKENLDVNDGVEVLVHGLNP